MPLPIDLSDVIRRRAASAPAGIAAIIGGQAIAWATLDARADRVAAGLHAAGCGVGDRLAVLARNAALHLEVLIAATRTGMVLVPINWRLAEPEVRYILEHAAVAGLLYDLEFSSTAQAATPAMSLRLQLSHDAAGAAGEYAGWRDEQVRTADDAMLHPGMIFLQMYTSGTTGRPKGVQLSYGNYAAAFGLMHQFAWNQANAADTLFTPAPFFHINGMNLILRSLLCGARLISVDQFRAAAALDMFAHERVTRATLTPAMILACLAVPDARTRDFSALQLVFYAGSPITDTVLHSARALFGCDFAQGYGMTEAAGAVTMLTPDDHRDDRKLRSCGRPIPGIELMLVQADGQPCAVGKVGEVLVRGDFVTPGYRDDAAATAQTIVDGWLHTGDAAFIDADGYLYLHDRLKDMIVTGGENVYPAEVENALFKNPAVADAAVIGVPDPLWGEAVKAFIVLKPGTTADSNAIIRHARQHIAGFKLPKTIAFIEVVPRNPAGKILRRELRDPFWRDRDRAIG